jgi:ribosomal protein S18 acetylase RimI-like enzyme
LDFARWMATFEREIDGGHRVFMIDRGDGAAGDETEFVAAGFELERTHVLLADRVVPPARRCIGLEVRPLDTQHEWEAVLALELDVAVQDGGYEDSAIQRDFRIRRAQARRRMHEQGVGHVWGAFLRGRLVGSLGLFHVDELSRFQSVATHRDHRRSGVCSTLVHEVCTRALAERPGRRLVMLADEAYHATRIYQSLGFGVAETLVAYVRRPQPNSFLNPECGYDAAATE